MSANLVIPEYSSAAKYGRSVFFEEDNDIDIYVEDTAAEYKKIYCTLLKRILGNIKLTQIFPLGCRKNVTDRASEYKDKRPAIFLCDGDLYLMSEPTEALPPRTVRLEKYCIENYLLDFDAINKSLDEIDYKKDTDEIARLTNFSEWCLSFADELKKLFIAYGYAHKINKDIKTIGYCKDYKLAPNEEGILCKETLILIREQLLTQLSKLHPGINHADAMANLFTDIDPIEFIKTYASAKDYILPFALRKARHVLDIKIDNSQFKLMLAHKCKTDDFRKIIMPLVENRDLT